MTKIKLFDYFINPRGCRFCPTPVGVSDTPPPPLEIKEGVVLGPMLLYISWTYLEIELTCKQLGKSLKNLARFKDLKILKN